VARGSSQGGGVSLDPVGGDVTEQCARASIRGRYRLDVREAPLLRIFIAEDRGELRAG